MKARMFRVLGVGAVLLAVGGSTVLGAGWAGATTETCIRPSLATGATLPTLTLIGGTLTLPVSGTNGKLRVTTGPVSGGGKVDLTVKKIEWTSSTVWAVSTLVVKLFDTTTHLTGCTLKTGSGVSLGDLAISGSSHTTATGTVTLKTLTVSPTSTHCKTPTLKTKSVSFTLTY
jgi:hypothetical protein